MANFYMCVGLPGSGKSTIAATQTDAVIISSDAIREELYGDERILGTHNDVFGTMLQRTLAHLKNGQDVVYDATNLSRRRRKGVLLQLPKETKKICILVWARYETCLHRNSQRPNPVPGEAIHRMLLAFQMPFFDEGWDEITTWYTDTPYDAIDLLNRMDIPHDTHFHPGTIYEHVSRVQKAVSDNFPTSGFDKPLLTTLRAVATWHDIGKIHAKTFQNSRGEITEDAHYYGHENASAYLYCGIDGVDTNIRAYHEIAYLINMHMARYNQDSKYYDSLPEQTKKILEFFGECDKQGA